jgi:hypothetical protein
MFLYTFGQVGIMNREELTGNYYPFIADTVKNDLKTELDALIFYQFLLITINLTLSWL